MDSFFTRTGPRAIGSRLRLLSERLGRDAARVYRHYGLDFEVRWFPVLQALIETNGQTVNALADATGQSQVSVSQVIKAMSERGLVTLSACPDDGRRTVVTLTQAARAALPRFQAQMDDVGAVMDDVLSATEHNLWRALDDFEAELDKKGFYDRIRELRPEPDSGLRIVPYAPEHRTAFRDINVEWISAYFAIEPEDVHQLEHPEALIAGGGTILIAELDGAPVGTTALIRMSDRQYELAKMAVTPAARGHGAGLQLGRAAIAEARRLGAEELYLESNRSLEPAIALYRKLGFVEVDRGASPYARCDIQMALDLGAAA